MTKFKQNDDLTKAFLFSSEMYKNICNFYSSCILEGLLWPDCVYCCVFLVVYIESYLHVNCVVVPTNYMM